MFVKQRHAVIVAVQVVLITVSAALAWLLRFDFDFPRPAVFFWALPFLVLARLLAMAPFNLFHGYWRYTGINDAFDIVKAVSIGSIAFWGLEHWILGVSAFPTSIYCIEAVLTGSALCGVRLFSRAILQGVQNHTKASNKTVVVIGAGCGAAMLLRELPRSGYTAVALIDDDPTKLGIKLHGVKVEGRVSDLPEIVGRFRPDELMIAIPSANGEQMRQIAAQCQLTEVQFRTIPGLADLIHGTVMIDQLREVNIEDLLNRDPVNFNLDSVKRRIAGRVVMVTGAAGSIGSELSRQLLRYAPSELICVDQAETPLFYLQQSNVESKVKQRYRIADITDGARMREIIQQCNVRVIFHAAAYKHVPMVEENLREATKNNVFGLLELIELADQCGCEDFLLISSDKAVNPSSFMGCTKRIGELIVAAGPSAHMRCFCVRFGNVLGSQGSVVPVFQEQIKSKRVITVTHPDITRYFMTIPEAVSLVLQAFSIASSGDILVLDMGKPIRILDMAKTLIHLSGIPQKEVKIVFTGLRPGEKLFEELFYDFEKQSKTSAKGVLRTCAHLTPWEELLEDLRKLGEEVNRGSLSRIRLQVKRIVPQYQWAGLAEAPEQNAQQNEEVLRSQNAPVNGKVLQQFAAAETSS